MTAGEDTETVCGESKVEGHRNYSKFGTEFGDEVLLMEVKNVNRTTQPFVDTIDTKLSRDQYSECFREINKRGK